MLRLLPSKLVMNLAVPAHLTMANKLVGIDINRGNRLGCHWCYSWRYTTITRQGLRNTLADCMRHSLTTGRTFTDNASAW